MNVLMVGVDASTKGGMWSVVENYLNDKEFLLRNNLTYIPVSVTRCSALKKIFFTGRGFLRIRNVLRKNSIDITHVHMSERGSVYRKGIVMRMAKEHGSKVVLHMHGAEFEDLYQQMSDKNKKKVREILNLADRIIILGEYWKPFIASLMEDPSKVQVVYNAVDVPDRYCYDKNSRTVLFLGELSQRKGIDTLLQSLQIAAEKLSSECQVKLFGSDIEGTIENKIAAFGLNSWVSYEGYISGKDKVNQLSHSAVNVLPSYNEGLPMTILESMAYGVPSVSTAIAAIPEAVNTENGILIDPGDSVALSKALIKILLNDEYRNKLSIHAYQDAKEHFSIQKHTTKIEEIYQELYNEKE